MERLRADAKRIAERDVPAAKQKSAEAKVDNTDALAQGAEALAKVAKQSSPDKAQSSDGAKQVAEMIPSLKSADTSLRLAADTAAKVAKDAAKSAPPNSSASAAQAQSAKAADAAGQLLKDAKEMLDRLQSAQDGGGIKLAQAAKQQEDIGQSVKSASDNLDRALRHEERLNTPKGEMLQQVSDGTKTLADKSLPPVPDSVAKAKDSANAAVPVQKAEKEVSAAAIALQAALAVAAPEKMNSPPEPGQENKDGNNSGNNQSGGDQKSEDAKAMARALDRLDEQMNGKPGKPGDQQNQEIGRAHV